MFLELGSGKPAALPKSIPRRPSAKQSKYGAPPPASMIEARFRWGRTAMRLRFVIGVVCYLYSMLYSVSCKAAQSKTWSEGVMNIGPILIRRRRLAKTVAAHGRAPLIRPSHVHLTGGGGRGGPCGHPGATARVAPTSCGRGIGYRPIGGSSRCLTMREARPIEEAFSERKVRGCAFRRFDIANCWAVAAPGQKLEPRRESAAHPRRCEKK